jgi:NitT/TauT family transport system substrate-binding protein
MAALATVVVACTAASTPTPASTPAPTASGSGAATAAPKGELPKPELSTLRIAFSAGGEISQFAAIQAAITKTFDKYGLSATTALFEGDTKAVGALQAGQVDFATFGPGTAMSSHLGDVPLVVIAQTATILTDDLVCSAEVKAAADVKGKRVAISTFGGTSFAAALLALKSLNLGAADAQITQIGGQSARIAALKGGSVDCAVIDRTQQADMMASGFNIVAKIYEPPQPFGRSGMGTTKAFLDKYPNTVLVGLAAILEGQNLTWTDPTGAAQRFAQHAQTDVAEATPLVEDFQKIGNRSLMWTDEIFNIGKKITASVNPDVIDVDPAKAQDPSLLKKLVDIGFYEKIGNPATCPTWTTTKPC